MTQNFTRKFMVWLTLGLTLLALAPGLAAARPQVTIGVMTDDDSDDIRHFRKLLAAELVQVAGSRYEIRYDEQEASVNWSQKTAEKRYQSLIQNKGVDLILSLGIVSSQVVASAQGYPKPVVAVGVIDPVLQGVKKGDGNASGIKNLTYIHFNRSMIRDLSFLGRMGTFEKVAVVQDPAIIEVLQAEKKTLAETFETPVEMALIPAGELSVMMAKLEGVDAVYIGYLGSRKRALRKALIDALNARKILTFGDTVEDVREGMLAAAAPETVSDRIARRIAVNIDSWQGGEKLAALPVNLDFKEILTINMKTARAIGYSPSFKILSEAELVGDLQGGTSGITLTDAVHMALSGNHDLKATRWAVRQAKASVTKAKTAYLPKLTLVGQNAYLDEDVARTSAGTKAERTVSAQAKVDQLLFSDEASSSIGIGKDQLASQEADFQALTMDTVVNTATAFANLLKAETDARIQKENVALLKKNLAIAKQREVAGYAGRGDIFSWESRLASARTSLVAARAKRNLAVRDFNIQMGLPLDNESRADGSGLDAFLEASYFARVDEHFLSNPKAFNTFHHQLVARAQALSPEIASLDYQIEAVKRRVGMLSRKNWVPTVNATASWNRDLSRSGVGDEPHSAGYHEQNWNAAVQLSWSLFAGGENRVELSRQRMEVRRLQEQRIKQMKAIHRGVREALLESVTQHVNREQAERSAEFARKSLALISDSYGQGRASLADLVEAQNASLTADLTATNAVSDQMVALLKLERAVGLMGLLSTTDEQNAFLETLAHTDMEKKQ